MKRVSFIAAIVISIFMSSCDLSEIDNYDGPNATISGGIYDVETGELVEQDIIRGMQIEYVEQGYANPETQYMVAKNDGTYQNKMMFANRYTIRPVRGNFVPVAGEEVEVKGNTVHDFKVQPYIRIKNGSIEQVGNKIVATFSIQQTVTNNVRRVALFAHPEVNVGDPLNSVNVQQQIDAETDESTVYRLEIDLDANSGKLQKGKPYYFRIGALIDASEAKFNYLTAERLTIQ